MYSNLNYQLYIDDYIHIIIRSIYPITYTDKDNKQMIHR